MYESNAFNKLKMMNWENQPINIKTNFALARNFFEKLIKLYNT
jgi:hypothetical protein